MTKNITDTLRQLWTELYCNLRVIMLTEKPHGRRQQQGLIKTLQHVDAAGMLYVNVIIAPCFSSSNWC
eukprot:4931497-Amphidinium_carterae.2